MFNLKLEVENFLAIKRAKLESNSNITFIIAPNRAGKTQIMLFLYSFFWSLWRKRVDELFSIHQIMDKKLKNVFLVKNLEDLISWNADRCRFSITINEGDKLSEFKYIFEQERGRKENPRGESVKEFPFISKSPVYVSPAGLGEYYKGIWAIKKYYEKWRLVSEATTDLLHDLFIIATEGIETKEEENKKTLSIFEKMFQAKFFIKNERIYVQESGKSYGIEKTASGLKSLSWLYLILKYNLIGEVIFIDEPEVNLHPEYIDKIATLLYRISINRKVFVATHSDYLLESFNKIIRKVKGLRANVWIGRIDKDGAIYEGVTVDKDNLIDTAPLNEVYMKIVRELFGYEEEIGL